MPDCLDKAVSFCLQIFSSGNVSYAGQALGAIIAGLLIVVISLLIFYMFIIVTQDLCFKPETFSEDVMNIWHHSAHFVVVLVFWTVLFPNNKIKQWSCFCSQKSFSLCCAWVKKVFIFSVSIVYTYRFLVLFCNMTNEILHSTTITWSSW